MALVNGNFAKLKESYLFADIAARVRAFSEAHPEKKIIKMDSLFADLSDDTGSEASNSQKLVLGYHFPGCLLSASGTVRHCCHGKSRGRDGP